MEFFIGFGFGFSVAVCVLYKINNNTTPFSWVMDSLTPKVKYKVRVPRENQSHHSEGP